jgi:dTDP-3,4-didehydro-2,6-dideoxy-alpha-D-glucose 3-reductase
LSELGLGIWTLGNHARRNLVPAALEAPSWALRGVTSRDPEACEAVSAETGARAFPNADAMLADGMIDAVLIASPNGLHFEQARRALLAGKHVFVEKSLAGSLAEAELLLAMAEERGLVLAECFMYAFHPQFEALADLLSSGALGPIRTVSARFGFPHLAASDIRYSRDLQGGALLDAGAYCISALRALLGGNASVSWARLERSPAFEVDIGGSAALTTEDLAGLADWGFGRAYRNEIELWTERATVRASRAFSKPPTLETEIVIVHQENNRREVRAIPAANHFVRMLECFAEACASRALRIRLAAEALSQAQALHDTRVLSGDLDGR